MPTPKAVYEVVAKRSGGLCELCKRKAEVMHHCPARKMGGTKQVYTEREVFNLCVPCHQNIKPSDNALLASKIANMMG